MIRALACVVALLVSASSAEAQMRTPEKVYWVTLPVFATLAVQDAITTYDCVSRYSWCKEANPVIRPFVENHGIGPAMTGKVAVQGAEAVFVYYALQRWPEQGEWIVGGFVVATAGQAFVNYLNKRTISVQLKVRLP